MGIRQLANELQLSIGTVSRALNDRPDVNPETRARVKAAAARAGYVPNQSGRSLRSGRTGMVAAVIPTRARPSADSGLLTVLEGARRTLRSQAIDLIVLFRGPEEDPLESLQRIVQRRIADAVIISETMARDPRLAYLQAAGVEYVAFGRSAGMEDYPFVDFDVEAMAAETARLFVRDGHRRMALATNASRSTTRPSPRALSPTRPSASACRARQCGRCACEDGRLAEADRRRFAEGDGPSAVLATHESLAAGALCRLRRSRAGSRHRRLAGLHLPRRRHARRRTGALALPRRPRRGRRRPRPPPAGAHARQPGRAAGPTLVPLGSPRAPATGARRSGFRG